MTSSQPEMSVKSTSQLSKQSLHSSLKGLPITLFLFSTMWTFHLLLILNLTCHCTCVEVTEQSEKIILDELIQSLCVL